MTNEAPVPDLQPFELVLNRQQLAISLRQQGIDVDFEDWDGLCDYSVSRIAAVLAVHNCSREGDTDEV